MNIDWTKWKIEIKERPQMNPNNRNFGHGLMPMQGRILNPQAQSMDDFFSGPAITVSGMVPLLMADGSIRLAFCEQVFTDGKQHFRTAISIPKDAFNSFVETLVKFRSEQLESKGEAPDAREAS
jgi:hypothetical protein